MPKWCLILAALILTPFKAIYANCCSPCGCPGAFVELQTLWVTADDDWSHFVFARTLPNSVSGDINGQGFHLRQNDWDWAYRAVLGYDFRSVSPCYSWGAAIETTYFRISDNQRTPDDVTLLNLGLIDTGFFTDSSADLTIRYYTLDALAHFYSPATRCLLTDWYAGLRYAQLKEDITIHNEGSVDLSFEHSSTLGLARKFDGVGPRAGVAFYVPFFYYFAFTADISGSFVYGNRQHSAKETLITRSDDGVIEIKASSSNPEGKGWVNNVALQGGIAYKEFFCKRSMLLLELGYRYEHYSNILTTQILSSPSSEPIPVTHDDDFAFDGPYLKFAWHF